MKCSEVQELLSAYHDGELAPERQRLVEEHLTGCPVCTERLRELRQMSLAMRRLDEPQPADDLWEKLAERLDREIEPKRATSPDRRKGIFRRAVALGATAAFILLGVAIWIGRGNHQDHNHSAADIGHYLVEYREHPDEVQRDLNAKYQGRQVDLREAERELHFRPVTVKRLPGEISLKNIYLLKMPCCLCVQSIYERPDGSPVMLLEHEGEQAEWFGDRRAIKATCCGKPASIVQCDGELAVTWKCRKRFVTIVGVRDLEEINSFVAYLDDGGEDGDG